MSLALCPAFGQTCRWQAFATSQIGGKARWQQNCGVPEVMIKVSAALLFIVLLATGCSTTRTASTAKFMEEDKANLIIRYYTDDTSYLLKPTQQEGPFLTILNKDEVIDVAKHQPNRDLAVVILIHYIVDDEAEAVKHKWMDRLTGAGYKSVVFLQSRRNMQVNGLPVLASKG
jgi:hypothetical protein